jgi:CHAT domain-containing protein
MNWTYTDFDLEVRADGTIEARAADAGEVQARLDLRMNELALALRLIEAEPGGQTNLSLLRSFGSQLYRGLFPADIHTHFQRTLAAARVDQHGVRIRLNIESLELAALPWEFLYDLSSDTFLAQSPETVLSRYIDVPLPRREVRSLTHPLRILFAVARPQDCPDFDPEQEQKLTREALSAHIAAGTVAIDCLDHATPQRIRRQLREQDYTVLHFVGHGAFRDDKGWIVLEDDDGMGQQLDEEAFSAFFLGERRVSLVVLHACQGAKQSSMRPLAGIAPRLVARGLPAVIAMGYPVAYSTARLFSDEFYHALAHGWPVDAAVQTARTAIAQDVGFDLRDFATPILFMRAPDGVLLTSLGTS